MNSLYEKVSLFKLHDCILTDVVANMDEVEFIFDKGIYIYQNNSKTYNLSKNAK